MINSTLSFRRLCILNLKLHLNLLKFLIKTKDLPIFFLQFLSVIILAHSIINKRCLLLFIIFYYDLSLSRPILALGLGLATLAIHAVFNPH